MRRLCRSWYMDYLKGWRCSTRLEPRRPGWGYLLGKWTYSLLVERDPLKHPVFMFSPL
jgi:hypothetical protein